ncbi:hypothetical protein ACFX2I_008472 [Malus domestica]
MLFLCDRNVTGSSRGNSLLQSKVRLRTTDVSPPRPSQSRSLVGLASPILLHTKARNELDCACTEEKGVRKSLTS